MEPESEEWPLREPNAGTSAQDATGGAGPRLAALLDHAPRFPKLPASDAFVYGSTALSRKQDEAAKRQQRQAEAQREASELAAGSASASAQGQLQDLVAGAAATAAAPRHPASHRVHFMPDEDESKSEMESQGSEELGHSGLYDDDEEKEDDDPEEDSQVARASSPPDADAGPDEVAALPHSNEAMRRAAVAQARADEELLYDPKADEEDERWMREQITRVPQPRTQQRQKRKNGPGAAATAAAAAAAAAAASAAAPRTSAHLACPACFTPLCFDCQRHATRPTLFRAMFVTPDVLVDKGRQVRPEAGSEDDDPNLKYFAVLCRTCKSHVGVVDSDEVYHFFKSLHMQRNTRLCPCESDMCCNGSLVFLVADVRVLCDQCAGISSVSEWIASLIAAAFLHGFVRLAHVLHGAVPVQHTRASIV